MSAPNQFNQTWGSPTTDIPTISHPLTTPQYGAPAPHYQPRNVDTMTSATHGHIHPAQLSPIHSKASHPTGNSISHSRHQPPVVSPTLPQDPTSGLEHHPSASEHQPWISDGGNGRHPQISPVQTPIYNSISQGRRVSNSLHDASPQKCRIPDCTLFAYYDVSEQEQTEYCGQGHELQAVATGLVASCVMCKGRPRRTNERVCSRTCAERERRAPRVEGSYYGVPVVRRDPRARPGA